MNVLAQRPVFAALAVVAAVTLGGCGACSDVGCGPVAVIRLTLVAAPQTGTQVTACRSGTCATGVLPSPAAGVGVPIDFSGSVSADLRGLLWARNDGSLQVEVSWTRPTDPVPQEGDWYTLTAGSGGVTIAGVGGTANYSTVRPGGDACVRCTVSEPLGNLP